MGILETLSKNLEGSIIDELAIRTDYEKQDDLDGAELEMYQAFADSSTAISVGFAAITPTGDYYVSAGTDSRLVIVMKKEDASRWENAEISRDRRANLLGVDIDVRVKEVDREKKIVYVEAIKRERNIGRDQVNAELSELFNAAERTKTDMLVPVAATVIGVYDRYVILNVARAGVLARVTINNWAKYYVRDLHVVVRRGDTVKINITGKARMRGVRTQAWEAEHASFTRDPWASVDTTRVGKDSVVVCECTEANYGMNRWWGRPVDSSVLPVNLELMGDMKTGENAVRPEVGKVYKCTVINANPERRSLVVRPYQEVLENRRNFGVNVKK